MEDKAKIVILPYYHFPCTEPVLVNVFAKELGKTCDIIWLFQGDTSKGIRKKWHNSRVLLCRAIKGDNLPVKGINKLMKWWSLFQMVKLLRSHNIRIVLIRDLPLKALLIMQLRLFFKFRVYYQHSAPQGEIALSKFKVEKTFRRYYNLIFGLVQKVLVNEVVKRADIIFPITSFHKEELLIYNSADKLVPLTMGVDEEWINRPKNKIPYLMKLKKINFILTYFGTLTFCRKPQFILEIFSEVKKACPNCKLLMMGETESRLEKNELQLFCRKLGIQKDVIFTGQLNRNDLQDNLQYCDLSISAIPPEDHYKISSPTKMYESLGNGVPVVANRDIYEQEKVILESGGGIVVDYDVISFKEAIVSLFKDRDLRDKMSRDGKDYVLKNYTYKMIAKKIAPYFE